MSDVKEKTGSKWLKIVKLFFEFVVAAITAWLAASCVKMF